jgi:hypothetical protein
MTLCNRFCAACPRTGFHAGQKADCVSGKKLIVFQESVDSASVAASVQKLFVFQVKSLSCFRQKADRRISGKYRLLSF